MAEARNHHVSWSESNSIMASDGNPGTWSIQKSDYDGIKIGKEWVYLISRSTIPENQLLKQSEYHTEHKLSHIIVGNSVYQIGD